MKYLTFTFKALVGLLLLPVWAFKGIAGFYKWLWNMEINNKVDYY